MGKVKFSKKSAYWLIGFGVLLLLLGLCSNFFWWKADSGLIPANILNILPGPLLILTGFWLIRAKRFRNAVAVLGIMIAVPLTLMMLFGIYLQVYLGPHQSPALYGFFLKRYENTPYKRVVSHFPKKIPEDAKEVRFFHQPHFMMGGMSLQLRYVLPAEEIEALLNESLEKAKQVQETDGDYLGFTGPKGLPIPRLCAGEKDYVHWPKGYKIVVFNAEDRAHGSWNHGFSCGVAISMARNEVVYWAEDW